MIRIHEKLFIKKNMIVNFNYYSPVCGHTFKAPLVYQLYNSTLVASTVMIALSKSEDK